MNRNRAVAIIQEQLGFSTALSSNIVAALQDCQAELETRRFLPKFLVVYEQDLVTVADQETVNLPTGFLRENEDDGPLYYIDEDGGRHELDKQDMTFLRQAFRGELEVPSEGAPQAYALGSTALHIFPKPDDVYNLKFSFYKADDVLSEGASENKWLIHAPDVLVGMAGLRIAMARRDKDAITWFSAMEAKGLANLIHAGEAREHEGRKYVMGGEN